MSEKRFGDKTTDIVRRRCAEICTLLFGICILPAAVFLLGQSVPVSAEEVTKESIQKKQDSIDASKSEREQIKSSISDLQKMKKDLEASKANLKEYVTQLDAKATSIQENIDGLKKKISDKEDEIEEAQKDLEEAQKIQQEQYEVMKKRIRFIYEKGNTYYLEALLQSGSFADMLNKATYVEMLSEYDQKLLEQYKEQTEMVKVTKKELEEDKKTLDEAKSAAQTEESNMESLIAEKNTQIQGIEGDISSKEQSIQEYEAQVAQQDATIAALEQQVANDKKTLAAQEAAANAKHYTGGVFTWPAPSYTEITSEFGNRVHPIYGVVRFHSGLDMAAPYGSPILAAADGTVVAASYDSSMGNYVMIDHGGGLYTVYMHASALYVSTGQEVTAGTQIAAVGSTGASTGPHLHFSVRLNGSYVSPWNYLGH
ncbi:MAG: peptidoglycan DD-metalloendopeptidase family protein [Lachnospiraceae bacterium]|nr:peptidoglycan DD-metalloendopeptidase family protein [Lachnospiraceae bacterium]